MEKFALMSQRLCAKKIVAIYHLDLVKICYGLLFLLQTFICCETIQYESG